MGSVGGKRNYGYGKQLAWVGQQALRDRYGSGHYATRAAHAERWQKFAQYLKEQGIHDARQINQAIIEGYAQTLKQAVDNKTLSVAYAQNLLSTVNVVLATLRKDRALSIPPRQFVGERSHVRQHAPCLDRSTLNAADFFSNHPFHIRMEEFSRRLWAPAVRGATRESKWFYERARGQYADAQAKVSKAEKKKFLADFPTSQMFSKTDLAKFENVWDEKPTHVNYGAQKNFAQYARRIGQEWLKSPDSFNEFYFKRIIARAIIFKRLEKMVSSQPWYSGGYRANIVAYTLAMISKLCADAGKSFDFLKVWETQDINEVTVEALLTAAKFVHGDIMNPPAGISNISEWCKKEACWDRLQGRTEELKLLLTQQFLDSLISNEEVKHEVKSAAKVQKIDSGVVAQKKVFEISAERWKVIALEGTKRNIFSPKELGILQIAVQLPSKIPSDKQSVILLEILEKATLEGIAF